MQICLLNMFTSTTLSRLSNQSGLSFKSIIGSKVYFRVTSTEESHDRSPWRYDSCPHTFFRVIALALRLAAEKKLSFNKSLQDSRVSPRQEQSSVICVCCFSMLLIYYICPSPVLIYNSKNVELRGRDGTEGLHFSEQLCSMLISFSCWFGDTDNKKQRHHTCTCS